VSILDQVEQTKDVMEVQLIRLSRSHLRTVGDIGLCRNLTICILDNNYMTRFDALVACEFLLKLDLHSNQVCWHTRYNLR